jgi:hypothetical protein
VRQAISFKIIHDTPGVRACDDSGLARKSLSTSAILEGGIKVGVGLEINEPGKRSACLLRELLDLLGYTCQPAILDYAVI